MMFIRSIVIVGLLSLLLGKVSCFNIKDNVKDSNGIVIRKICPNCTYVEDGRYIQTDIEGNQMVNFRCDRNDITQKFCATPGIETIPFINGEYYSVCTTNRFPRVCLPEVNTRLNLWGDGRMDHEYKTALGAFNQGNITQAKYDRIANGSYTDIDRQVWNSLVNFNKGPEGSPGDNDAVYAHYNADIHDVLFGNAWPLDYPAPYRTAKNIANFPKYKTNQKQLLLNFGFNNGRYGNELVRCNLRNEYGSDYTALVGGGRDCLFKELYSYLSKYSDFETYHSLDVMVSHFQFKRYSPLVIGNTIAAYENENFCTGSRCFSNLRPSDLRVEILPWTTGHVYTMGMLNQGNSFKPVNSPASINPQTISGIGVLYTEFKDPVTGDHLKYPYFILPHYSINEKQTQNLAQWVEESDDGINWQRNPEVLTNKANSYNVRSFPDNFEELFLTTSWPRLRRTTGFIGEINIDLGTGDRYRQIVRNIIPGMKYLRIVSVKAFGSYGFSSSGSEVNDIWIFPTHILTAHSNEPLQLSVWPSYSRVESQTSNGFSTYGGNICNSLVNCEIIPNGNQFKYPSDGHPSEPEYGSATEKELFYNEFISPIFPCDDFVENPLRSFIDQPAKREDKCYRFTENEITLTCFRYRDTRDAERALLSPGSDLRVQTDVASTFARYVTPNYVLTVSTEYLDSQAFFPVPEIIIGPWNVRDLSMANSIRVYRKPVTNSFRMGNIYIAFTEQCNFQDPALIPNMTFVEDCNCIDAPISATYCLCDDLGSYKSKNQIPTGVAFKYPYFFSPYKFPVNFTVKAQELTYDSNTYTRIAIDCEQFLCSNHPECKRLFQSSATNYVNFCRDQEAIVTTVLRSLQSSISQLDLSLNTMIENTRIGDTEDLSDIVLQTGTINPVAQATIENKNTQLGSFGIAVKNYFSKARSTTLERYTSNARSMLGPSAPSGYNYRNPWTTPGEAFGLSIFPPLGVGLLTEKINTLAYQSSVQNAAVSSMSDYVNTLSDTINDLSANVADALENAYTTSVALANGLNSAIDKINGQFNNQNQFNKDLLNALNQFAETTTNNQNELATSINFLDYIGSRASTLSTQMASVMVIALDREVKAREFENRAKACTGNSKALSHLCTGIPESQLLASMIKKQGTVTMIENLMLIPSNYHWAYSAPEFCYQGHHYLVRSPENIFVLVDAEMYISNKEMWSPQNISNENTIKLPECKEPNYIIEDLRIEVPIIPLPSNTALVTVLQPPRRPTILEITTAVLQNISRVNISEELENFRESIMNITTNIPDFVFPTVAPGFFPVPDTGLSTLELILIIVGVICGTIIISLILWVIIKYCYQNNSSYYKI